ncbi:hypothetical protein HYFRA_00011993 [Hymenoscyphus fraxineus]|uniref:Uncharacterized protein n=1 Tax=Hymenoscyphus fraxineus TaxID=746836 RepID=A0A9N9L3K5_9HELO|nr:hypothetical protein HYFRA_00011993 [Hymenoscyphus fraxineus]
MENRCLNPKNVTTIALTVFLEYTSQLESHFLHSRRKTLAHLAHYLHLQFIPHTRDLRFTGRYNVATSSEILHLPYVNPGDPILRTPYLFTATDPAHLLNMKAQSLLVVGHQPLFIHLEKRLRPDLSSTLLLSADEGTMWNG